MRYDQPATFSWGQWKEARNRVDSAVLASLTIRDPHAGTFQHYTGLVLRETAARLVAEFTPAGEDCQLSLNLKVAS